MRQQELQTAIGSNPHVKTEKHRRIDRLGDAGARRAGQFLAFGKILEPDTKAESDPIFAAIERHKATWCRFKDVSVLTDNVVAKQYGREVTQKDLGEYEAASEAETKAQVALAAIAPLTAARACTAIRYFIDTDLLEDRHPDFLETLLKSPFLAA